MMSFFCLLLLNRYCSKLHNIKLHLRLKCTQAERGQSKRPCPQPPPSSKQYLSPNHSLTELSHGYVTRRRQYRYYSHLLEVLFVHETRLTHDPFRRLYFRFKRSSTASLASGGATVVDVAVDVAAGRDLMCLGTGKPPQPQPLARGCRRYRVHPRLPMLRRRSSCRTCLQM